MKKTAQLAAGLAFALSLSAQVPKKVVVEHFTNTLCSVCASRNPGFNTNLNNQSGVIRLSVHPSSPYSACVLNQHNVADNDGRTNYYSIYGSTPRLVIQGTNIATSANYSASSLFTPYIGQTSPASIRIVQTRFGNDSIRAEIIVKTEAAHTLGNLQLFVALAEDTVFYNAPNGEIRHYNVLRKALSGTSGVSLNLPANIGDSVVFTFSSANNPAWNFMRINTFAILQQSASKAVVQAEYYPAQNTSPNSVAETQAQNFSVFSTGLSLVVRDEQFTTPLTLTLYDVSGRIVLQQTLQQAYSETDLSALTEGIYLYLITEDNKFIQSGKAVR
ncbi:MAG: T9SS type A sorting domain-containing protein [Bacteroidetes bacterium]|nr:T9SS type A sorting domain-containing protein [Bacteroidota bacterium]